MFLMNKYFKNEDKVWKAFSNDSVYVVPDNECLKFWNLVSFVQFLNDIRIQGFVTDEIMFFRDIVDCYAGEAYSDAIDTITKIKVSFDEFFDSLINILEKYGIDYTSISVPDIKEGETVEMKSPCDSVTYKLFKKPGRYFPIIDRIC